MKKNPKEQDEKSQEKKKIFGDPEYSASEDIYSREKKNLLTMMNFPVNKLKKVTL